MNSDIMAANKPSQTEDSRKVMSEYMYLDHDERSLK